MKGSQLKEQVSAGQKQMWNGRTLLLMAVGKGADVAGELNELEAKEGVMKSGGWTWSLRQSMDGVDGRLETNELSR